jgi:3'-phosphoadenosine 5'-phosphosulfate sulfotransferase (PAPS reductase)/FAD synthetase
MPAIATTPEISALLAAHAPVAFGVSGGKDSSALALAGSAYLDQIGHRGPRVLVHSDLGRVEWAASLPTCERLARHLGLELITVRRQAGGLMERWLTRWQNNVARYANLECVKLILPWSTASMRFCTSELKTAVICRELVQLFPGQTILSASGIRREESPNRAKAPVAKDQPKLTSKAHQTSGYDWHPIIDWSKAEVLTEHARRDFPLHEAYTRYGSSRVSCAFCILGSTADLAAAASCADNHAIYCEMVDLEIASTFSFHDAQWLGDVAPHLISGTQRLGLKEAKRRARERAAAEARIPQHLLYTRGWPTVMPTIDEARLIAWVRVAVAEAVDIDVGYTAPSAVLDRYAELMAGRPQSQGVTVQMEMVL